MTRALALLVACLVLAAGCITPAAEWNRRGETHHTMGRYDEAVLAFDTAISLDPDYSEPWKNRGLSLALLGRGNESEDSFARAIALDPGDNEAYYLQALARNSTGNRTGALERLDKGIALPPRDRDQAVTLFQSLMLQGDLLTSENRTEEANVSYLKAHEVMMGTI